jgi:hypothetical protein
MTDSRMTFGKHKGLPVSDVPLAYLVWASQKLTNTPRCVVDELERRAGMHGTREAVDAAAAVSKLRLDRGLKKRKKKARWVSGKIQWHYRAKPSGQRRGNDPTGAP